MVGPNNEVPGIAYLATLWVLFFLICFGLGYPTLNRYDARAHADVADYYRLVTGESKDVTNHRRYRVLTPYLARPIYRLAQGHIGSWNPVFFALLMVNATLVATSACLVFILGWKFLGDRAVALVGALLYLLNFTVINGQLAGLVDAGESVALLLVALVLAGPSRFWLPIVGVTGALAKETFVPLSGVFAFVWWQTARASNGRRSPQLTWIIIMCVTGLGTVSSLQSAITGQMTWPWDILMAHRSEATFWEGLTGVVVDQSFLYVFIWLAPLGVLCIKLLPKPWVYASMVAAIAALAMGSWKGAGGNAARGMFACLGPVLSLSAASLLVTWGAKVREQSSRSGVSL